MSKAMNWDFTDGSVGQTLHFHCRGCQFDSWSGDSDPTCCMECPPKIYKNKTRKSSSIHLKGVQRDNREWKTVFKEIKGSDFLKTPKSCKTSDSRSPVSLEHNK